MTAAELAALHRRRAAAVPREFQRTMRTLAIVTVRFTREYMTKTIYAVREDLTAEGNRFVREGRRLHRRHYLWRRTGHLRRSERAEVVDPYTVRVMNDADYALPRHEAGKPGARKINPRRVSHWRDELEKFFQPLLAGYYQETVKRIMETR